MAITPSGSIIRDTWTLKDSFILPSHDTLNSHLRQPHAGTPVSQGALVSLRKGGRWGRRVPLGWNSCSPSLPCGVPSFCAVTPDATAVTRHVCGWRQDLPCARRCSLTPTTQLHWQCPLWDLVGALLLWRTPATVMKTLRFHFTQIIPWVVRTGRMGTTQQTRSSKALLWSAARTHNYHKTGWFQPGLCWKTIFSILIGTLKRTYSSPVIVLPALKYWEIDFPYAV